MYLMYVDESGDSGNNTIQSKYFCLSGIVIHETEWRHFIDRLVCFRRTMREVYGLPIRAEIHSAELIRKNSFDIPKHGRLAILRNLLDEVSKIDSLSITSVVIDKSNKPDDFPIFDVAWRTLFQRFENTLRHGNFPGSHSDDYGVVFTDATSGKKLTSIMRKMAKFNPIPSNFGGAYDNPVERIIEDPSQRDSKVSLPIQCCDVVAYFLLQNLDPNSYVKKKGARRYFQRLKPVLNRFASTRNDYGVVRI